ncbi:helix-turn-helix domain-containing protein [Archaeoglobus sp.]
MIAFNHGYFENPKKIKLEEIAEIIGVSKATASDLLRRAVKKVIKKYVSQL